MKPMFFWKAGEGGFLAILKEMHWFPVSKNKEGCVEFALTVTVFLRVLEYYQGQYVHAIQYASETLNAIQGF